MGGGYLPWSRAPGERPSSRSAYAVDQATTASRSTSTRCATVCRASPSSSDRIRQADRLRVGAGERPGRDPGLDHLGEQLLPGDVEPLRGLLQHAATGPPPPRRRATAGTPSPARPGCRCRRRSRSRSDRVVAPAGHRRPSSPEVLTGRLVERGRPAGRPSSRSSGGPAPATYPSRPRRRARSSRRSPCAASPPGSASTIRRHGAPSGSIRSRHAASEAY